MPNMLRSWLRSAAGCWGSVSWIFVNLTIPVQERLVAYKQQLAKVPKGSTPDFVFQRGTPYAKAVCFSCGATLQELQHGRCWRCSLAWRLAVGGSIPAERAAVYDGARVVA